MISNPSSLLNAPVRGGALAPSPTMPGATPAPAGTAGAPASSEFSRMLEHNQATAREAHAVRQARHEAHAELKPKSAEGKPPTPRTTPGAPAHEPSAKPEGASPTTDAGATAADAAVPERDRPARDKAAAAGTPGDESAELTQASAPDDVAAAEIEDTAMPLPALAATLLPPATVVPPSGAAPAETRGCAQTPINGALVGVAAGQPTPAAAADNVRTELSSPNGGAVEVPVAAASAKSAGSPAALDPSDAAEPKRAADSAAPRESITGHSPRPELTPDAALAALARSASAEPVHHSVAGGDAASGVAFGLSLASVQVARSGEVSAPVSVQANVPTPLSDPGFQQALGYQVSLLARDGVGHAELHLNPADMGPVSVQITMTGDQARVDFGADLAQTRQLLEAGWAELASSLKDAGFTLSGGGVSDHARERQAPQGQSASQSRGSLSARDSGETPAVAPVVARRVSGGVDVYA